MLVESLFILCFCSFKRCVFVQSLAVQEKKAKEVEILRQSQARLFLMFWLKMFSWFCLRCLICLGLLNRCLKQIQVLLAFFLGGQNSFGTALLVM